MLKTLSTVETTVDQKRSRFQSSKELQIIKFTLKRQCTRILRSDHCHMENHREFLEVVP